MVIIVVNHFTICCKDIFQQELMLDFCCYFLLKTSIIIVSKFCCIEFYTKDAGNKSGVGGDVLKGKATFLD